MVAAINYADANMLKQQKLNSKSAVKKGGVDRLYSYSMKDLDRDFKRRHKNILKCRRIAGFGIWKPYLILKTMERLAQGDYIVYADAGIRYVNKVSYLIDTMEKEGESIMVFEHPIIEKQFTKREAMKRLGCDDYETANSNQIWSGIILLRVNEFTKGFMEEWLENCGDEMLVSDVKGVADDYPEFIEHRHDQSLLSLQCKKYGIRPFRDPRERANGDYGREFSTDYVRKSMKKCSSIHKCNQYYQDLVNYRGGVRIRSDRSQRNSLLQQAFKVRLSAAF